MFALFRNIDLILLGLALPVFVVADLPLLGWVTAALLWLAWRAIGIWTDRKALAIGASDPAKLAGLATGSLIGRGWLLGATLLAVGLATDNRTGLSAALLATSFSPVPLS